MFEQVRKVISDQLGIDEAKITMETSLIDDLKADSLDIAALILELEEKFEIEVPDEDLTKLSTVGNIVSYVESKK